MAAAGAFDHQKVLPKFIGQALHLEISRHERYCIYTQSRITPIFIAICGSKFLKHHNWNRKRVSFLQQSRLHSLYTAGDPGVMGLGNWAQLPDGRMVGRSLHSGVYLCDLCGHEWWPVPTFESQVVM
jgi:hypothetical protein